MADEEDSPYVKKVLNARRRELELAKQLKADDLIGSPEVAVARSDAMSRCPACTCSQRTSQGEDDRPLITLIDAATDPVRCI